MRKNVTILTSIFLVFIGLYSSNLFSIDIQTDTSTEKMYNNPIIASRGVCDPHIHIFNNKAYLFASHDNAPKTDGSLNYVMKNWWVWSSSDLVHWNLEFTLEPKDMWVGATDNAWAVDGAERNGKYYFYVSGNWKTGVAVSTDGPGGPYKDALKTYISSSYDPTVFIDNDTNKTPYLMTSSFPYKIAKLNDDMISLAEQQKDIIHTSVSGNGDGGFLHKHNGLYYLNGHGNTYSTATNVYGPYTKRSNTFYKHWVDHPTFFTWHNQTYCTFGLGDTDSRFRKTHITYAHYKTNGDLVTDSDVGSSFIGVGQYDCASRIEAEWYFAASDSIKKVENGTGFIMKNFTNKAFLYYPRILNVAQNPTITFNLASIAGGDTIEIRKDSTNGALLGSVKIPATTNLTNFQTATAVLNCNAGVNNVYFVFKGTGSFANIDWFTITSTGALLAPCLPSPIATAVNAYQQIEAENYICNTNLQSETCSDIGGGKNIGYIKNLSSCSYKLDFGTNKTDSIPFQVRAASSNSSGCTIELRLDSKTGPLLGTCKITNTGGNQTWLTKDFNIAATSGVHFVHFVFKGGDGYLMNMNWFKFSTKTCQITLSQNGCSGSTTSGGGASVIGDTVRVTANAGIDCAFINWTENGVEQSNKLTYTFVASINRNLVANFKSTKSIITLSAIGCSGSTATGNGTFVNGDSVRVKANAARACLFVNWTENTVEQSTNPNYSFIASKNRALVANFKSNTSLITVSLSGCSGTVSGVGTLVNGDTAKLTANPTSASDCKFAYWIESIDEISENPVLSFVVSKNRSIIAVFKKTYPILLSANGCEGCSVTGDGIKVSDDSVSVTAIPANDCSFVNWTESNIEQSKDLTYSFVATKARNLVANFSPSTSISNIENELKIYPNPVSETLHIDFSEKLIEREISIINAIGQIVFNTKTKDSKIQLDIKSLKIKGIVSIQVKTEHVVLHRNVLIE